MQKVMNDLQQLLELTEEFRSVAGMFGTRELDSWS